MVLFPSVHFQLVGLPVERSEKFTTKGAQPDVGKAEKLACGWARHIKLIQLNSMDIQMDLTNVVGYIGFGFCFYEY